MLNPMLDWANSQASSCWCGGDSLCLGLHVRFLHSRKLPCPPSLSHSFHPLLRLLAPLPLLQCDLALNDSSLPLSLSLLLLRLGLLGLLLLEFLQLDFGFGDDFDRVDFLNVLAHLGHCISDVVDRDNVSLQLHNAVIITTCGLGVG